MISAHPSLEQAQILSINVCKEPLDRLDHRFVVLELSRSRRQTVWLRLDRKRRAFSFRRLFQSSSTITGDVVSALSFFISILVTHTT